MSRILALLLLVALLLPALLLAVLSLFFQGFPLFFVQERLGRDKKPFKLIKFRSMADGKVTRMGRFLRSSGVDELPQLVNVLKGDMVLIGPRPLTSDDVQRLGWDADRFSSRWSVCPGITGLAQLSPICHRRASWLLDQHYVKHRSRILDLKLVLASALVPIVGKKQLKEWIWQ